MVDSAREGKRQERLAALDKLRKVIAQQEAGRTQTQQVELRYLQEWESADRLFTSGWKAEGEKLKKELEVLQKEEGRTLYTEGRESKRVLMANSQAATAMGIFNKLSPRVPGEVSGEFVRPRPPPRASPLCCWSATTRGRSS